MLVVASLLGRAKPAHVSVSDLIKGTPQVFNNGFEVPGIELVEWRAVRDEFLNWLTRAA